MKRSMILVIAAGALAVTPAITGGPRSAPSPTTAPGQGQFHGQGYNHMNSGNAVGQPGQTCQTLIASGNGATPGNAGSAPGSGSPFDFSDTNSGSHYAGSQLQNSRNSASVSQYDVACSNQRH
jgi:hypothetical protein